MSGQSEFYLDIHVYMYRLLGWILAHVWLVITNLHTVFIY